MKEHRTTIIAVVLTAIITLGVSWLTRTSSAGIDAEAEAQIEKVLTKALTLPDQRTFAQAIISMEQTQAANSARLDVLVTRAVATAEVSQ